MAINYPTLSQNPDSEDFRHTRGIDPVIRNEMIDGNVATRARFTAVPRVYAVKYRYLPNVDKQKIENFEQEIQLGALPFNWTNPVDNKVREMLLTGPIEFKLEIGNQGEWQVAFIMVERRGSSALIDIPGINFSGNDVVAMATLGVLELKDSSIVSADNITMQTIGVLEFSDT